MVAPVPVVVSPKCVLNFWRPNAALSVTLWDPFVKMISLLFWNLSVKPVVFVKPSLSLKCPTLCFYK